jgi:succinate dehydrogenase flavin-adding protein (antitoxin of CptAB toxin-antitoxin module)
MRELDALLQAYLSDSYPALDPADKQRFAALLELPDPELAAYILGRDVPSDPELERLIGRVRLALHP